MKEILFEFSDLQILKEDGVFFAIYDAGAHQVSMRKDRITEEEAKLACSGKEEAMQMLFGLQQRLSDSGVDPYKSNYSPS